MRPIRLELEGFGAFRQTAVVDFADIELVALVGATGAGKSTLIDAITFALYGSVARYDDRKAVAPVINQVSTRARVRLDFALGDEVFSATRVVQRTPRGATTKEARLDRSDEPLASDAKSVTNEVTRLLGLDVEQFNRTVVLPQGRFADFLHDNPADRQATLRQLLGFDVYRRIAVAARQRAAVARNQADALRPDLDGAATDLTDERRAQLVGHRADVGAVLASFVAGCESLASLDAELTTVQLQSAELDERLELLDSVRAPGGLAELDERSSRAEEVVQRSAADVSAARLRRTEADQRVAAGPDLATCRVHLQQHEHAAAALDEHASTVVRLKIAEERRAVTADDAAAIEAAQAELDEGVRAALAADRTARRAVEEGPDPARVEHLITLRSRHASVSAALASIRTDADTTDAAVRRAELDAARAGETVSAAQARRDELTQLVGVTSYAHLLTVGAPCPLCLQDVDSVPEHHRDAELARATQALTSAAAAAEDARHQLNAVQRRAAELAAEQRAQNGIVEALAGELVDVPDDAVLHARLARVGALRNARAAAGVELERAEAAATAHRQHPDHVRRVEEAAGAEREAARCLALEEAQRRRLDQLRAELEAIPAEDAVRKAVDLAIRMSAEQRAAIDELHVAERAHAAAVTEQTDVAAASTAAELQLDSTRDRLARLGPPVLRGDRVAQRWATLVDWSAARRADLVTEHAEVTTRRSELEQRRATVDQQLRSEVSTVLSDVSGAPSAIRDRLTRAEESAARAVDAFDERRSRARMLQARVDGLVAEREVADELGRLLRADGFEAWLMEAALDELADAASVRLRELSSGQFSLEVVDRELMVRDHVNADELRSARTLSGGETFLASLSLSLALADATTELSSEGAPRIESIFLDEGFGTLDPDTLDVVATTIEELGSAGRMVAVVTHLRELADRIPVRLEVERDGTTSTVRRVDL